MKFKAKNESYYRYLSARKPAKMGEIPPMPYLIAKFIPYIKPTVFDGEIYISYESC